MREIPSWYGLSAAPEGLPDVVVLGCPFAGGDAFRGGSAAGPEAIRKWARTAEAITEDGVLVEGLRVVDYGDVVADDDSAEGRWRAVQEAADKALEAHPGAFLLGLGGDHAVTPPLAAAARAARGQLAFLLLDAHPDAFDRYDDDPLAHACVLPRIWDRGGFEPEGTCVVGVRSYAREELDVLGTIGLVVSAKAWAELGCAAVADAVAAATDGKPLYLSLDIDVLDPADAAATGYPVPGGASSRQLLDLLVAVWERQPVAAMDLVEVAPAIDPSGVTEATAAHLCLQVFGCVARHTDR